MSQAPIPDAVLPDSAQQFLAQLTEIRRYSPLSAKRYAQALRLLHSTHPQLIDVRPVDLGAILKQQRSAGLSPRSLGVMASAWRSYCRWAVKHRLIERDPTLLIATPKVSKPLPKALSADGTGGVLQEANTAADNPLAQRDKAGKPLKPLAIKHYKSKKLSAAQAAAQAQVQIKTQAIRARDAAILEMLYGTGLRAAELMSLDTHRHASSVSWLDVPSNEVQVLGKGGKTRRVPLPALTLTVLQHWLGERARLLAADNLAEPALFLASRGGRLGGTELRRATQAAASGAQLGQGLHPHMLRHSYASHLLQSSGDLRAVQELLGHSSIVSTQVYTRLDFLHLAKVYDAAHPRA